MLEGCRRSDEWQPARYGAKGSGVVPFAPVDGVTPVALNPIVRELGGAAVDGRHIGDVSRAAVSLDQGQQPLPAYPHHVRARNTALVVGNRYDDVVGAHAQIDLVAIVGRPAVGGVIETETPDSAVGSAVTLVR